MAVCVGVWLTVTVAFTVALQKPADSVTERVREPAVSHCTVTAFDVEPEMIVRSVAAPDTVQLYVLPAEAGVE